jgi:hypothetical protein
VRQPYPRSILIKKFYENWLKKGMGKPEALRAAQLTLKSMPQYRHPYHWAPFVMIGDWIDQKSSSKKPQQSRLFVYTVPEGVRVRILNIKPKFYQGIILKPGRYHVEVSADGYEMKKMWIKIGPGEDKNLRISLK